MKKVVDIKEFLIERFIELSKQVDVETVQSHRYNDSCHDVYMRFLRYTKKLEKFYEPFDSIRNEKEVCYGNKLEDLPFYIYPLNIKFQFYKTINWKFKLNGDILSITQDVEVEKQEEKINSLSYFGDSGKENFLNSLNQTIFYCELLEKHVKLNENLKLSWRDKISLKKLIKRKNERLRFTGELSDTLGYKEQYNSQCTCRFHETIYILHYKSLFTVLTKEEYDNLFLKIEENNDTFLRNELINFDPNFKKSQEKTERAKSGK